MELTTRTPRPQLAGREVFWNVGYLDVAAREGHSDLTDAQYEHMVQQFDEPAGHRDPRRSDVLDLDGIEDYFELRDKGGILGRINFRVYYAVFDEAALIVVLGCYKKEAEHQTPVHIKVRMRNRLRIVRGMIANLEREG